MYYYYYYCFISDSFCVCANNFKTKANFENLRHDFEVQLCLLHIIKLPIVSCSEKVARLIRVYNKHRSFCI